MKLARLQKALNYQFDDAQLLTLALTHRSAKGDNNERLEFLGDSILNHTIAESLFHRFPDCSEGEMSRMRAALVKGTTLAKIGADLALGDYLVLGEGERKSGGHRRASILADTVEAIIGAVLLDGGILACQAHVLHLYAQRLETLTLDSAVKDVKTRLQEYLQGRGKPLPVYEVVETTGGDHDQAFVVQCQLRSPDITLTGAGSSRQRAEKSAAELVLKALGVEDE